MVNFFVIVLPTKRNYLIYSSLTSFNIMPRTGKVVTPRLKYFRWMLPLLAYPISWFPDWLHSWILNWYFRNQSIHPCSVKATKQLISSSSVRNLTNMAHEEFETVNTADYHLIEKHLDKLWFYYGASDYYCPLEYYNEMKERFPKADITLCQSGFEHAFCLESSKEMAAIVWKYLVENVPEIL